MLINRLRRARLFRLAATAVVAAGLVVAPVSSAVEAAPATDHTYRIMPLGDSITKGVGQLDARQEYVGWRARLQQHLDSSAAPSGFRYDFVGSQTDAGASDGDHEGHGGWTIDQIAANVDTWMFDYQPDVILLHLGTNNVSKGEAPAVTAMKLQNLIAQIKTDSPKVRIFVAKIIGTNGIIPGEKAVNAGYASLIPGVVTGAGGAGNGVYLVDQSSVRGIDLYDYHHPNNRGYTKMAYNWYQAMRSVLGSKWRPVVNPYAMNRASICQFNYRTRKTDCAVRSTRQ